MMLRAASFLCVLALAVPASAAPRWRAVATRGGVLRASPVFGVLPPSGTPMVFGGCLVGHCDYDEPANFLASPQTLEGAEWGSAAEGPGVRVDAAGGVVGGTFVLHGGQFSEFGHAGVSADTWTFDGTRWQKLSGTNHPGPRFGASFAVDGSGNRAYLFGGRDDSNVDSDETWTFANGAWAQVSTSGNAPEKRIHGALAWDGTGFVYFGGSDGFSTDAMYRLDCPPQDPLACTWTPIPQDLPWPAPRDMHAMAWEPVRHVVVMFGGRVDSPGTAGAGPSNETWEWNGTRWSEQALSTLPKARYGHAMATDTVNGRVLVLGGANAAAGSSFDDVWAYAADPVGAPDAGSTAAPDAGVPAGGDIDAGHGGGDGSGSDGGSGSENGGSDEGTKDAAHGRYGCTTAAPVAALLPLVIALRRRRRS